MARVPLESSVLTYADYDAETRTLELGFKSGEVYLYLEVTTKLYREFMAAPSQGAFLNTRIKEHHRVIKL